MVDKNGYRFGVRTRVLHACGRRYGRARAKDTAVEEINMKSNMNLEVMLHQNKENY